MSCAPQRCEMSYMNPRYVPVRLPGEGAGGAVLYRYFDDLVFDTEERSCSLVLLFVPGHGGSHTQVRSIGSEVLKMAFARRKSVHVYTISTGEALSAFDGSVLEEQAATLRDALVALGETYRDQQLALPGLYVVAHSMGGIAALEALRHSYSASALVDAAAPRLPTDAVLLLGAPLQGPPFACSASLSSLYVKLRDFWAGGGSADFASSHSGGQIGGRASTLSAPFLPAFASVSGGCRDWYVPPQMASLSGVVPIEAVALNGATTATLPSVSTPTDHLSILWCRQLVRAVARSILDIASIRGAPAAISTAASSAERYHPQRVGYSQPLESRVATLRSSFLGCRGDGKGCGDMTTSASASDDPDMAVESSPSLSLLLPSLQSLARTHSMELLLETVIAILLLNAVAGMGAWLAGTEQAGHRWRRWRLSRTDRAAECMLCIVVAGVVAVHGVRRRWQAGDGSAALTAHLYCMRALLSSGLAMLLQHTLRRQAAAPLHCPRWLGGFLASDASHRPSSRQPLPALMVMALVTLSGLCTHPALSLPMIAIAAPTPTDTLRAAAPLSACAFVALGPSVAAWVRRGVTRGPAVLFSSDARDAFSWVLLILIAHAAAACSCGERGRANSDNVAKSPRDPSHDPRGGTDNEEKNESSSPRSTSTCTAPPPPPPPTPSPMWLGGTPAGAATAAALACAVGAGTLWSTSTGAAAWGADGASSDAVVRLAAMGTLASSVLSVLRSST
jgi:hypothetical protein